jgi:hypothetical protein
MAAEAKITAAKPRRRLLRGDLTPAPMVVLTVEDWRNPAAALDTLRRWAENEAGQAIEWYLRDKIAKRLGSRILRALAILLAVAGGVAPLLTAGSAGNTNWGYVLLALAAGCLAFDHFFGLSSGWMRDIATVQALQRRLAQFRFAWIEANAEQALSSTYAADVKQRLGLIERFAADLAQLVNTETGAWLTEFQTNMSKLDGQTQRAWPSGTRIPPGEGG